MAKVLIVDDHDSMREGLELLLRRRGHLTLAAANGAEGLEILESQDDVDLVVADLKMEPVDGMEMLRAVRQRAPAVDVLIITAYGSVEIAVEAMKAGAIDFIEKPFRSEAFAARVRDVCEFLDEVGLAAPLGRVEARVCYDDPCHLVHGQGVRAAPRRLLAAIPGVELVEHEDPTGCCGAAGTYNLTQPAMSRAVLSRKLDALAAADPDVVVSGNPGCLMQLRAGAASRRLRARVVHPVELLDEATAAASGRAQDSKAVSRG